MNFSSAVLTTSPNIPVKLLTWSKKAEEQTIFAGNHPGQDSIGVRFEIVADDEPVKIISFKINQSVDATGKTHFEPTKELTTYTIPYIGKSIAVKKVARPYAYIFPSAYGNIARKLMQHGVAVEQLRQPLTTQVEVYHITKMEWAEEPYQGHRTAQFTAEPEIRDMTFTPGDYLVRMAQPAANVAAFLLEPETPDGLAAWNFFDNIGEQNVIIVEDFLDQLGEKLLEDPEIRARYERLAQADPEFRTNVVKQRAFFLEHSPYADPNRYIFPVYRLLQKTAMTAVSKND